MSGIHTPPPAHPQLERAISNPILRSAFSLLIAGLLFYISTQVSKIESLDQRVIEIEKWRAVHESQHDRTHWQREFQQSQDALRAWKNTPDNH
jgi:hypothetical protein